MTEIWTYWLENKKWTFNYVVFIIKHLPSTFYDKYSSKIVNETSENYGIK